jgi:GTPase SAR1 family protein
MNHHNNNVPDNLNSHLNPNIPTLLITVIGMGGSGKTSYITRFLTGEFRDKYVGMSIFYLFQF